MAYPKTELINALRDTAEKIESGEWEYKWSNSSTCNCGLLARSLTGEVPLDKVGAWKKFPQSKGDPDVAECTESGLTFTELYERLHEAGLRKKDFVHLENLSNNAILQKAQIDVGNYLDVPDEHWDVHPSRTDSEAVVKYLRAWADLLEEARTIIGEKTEESGETTMLSDRDRDAFLDAAGESEPSEALLEAVETHNELIE